MSEGDGGLLKIDKHYVSDLLVQCIPGTGTKLDGLDLCMCSNIISQGLC